MKRWADYLVDNALGSENQYVLLQIELGNRLMKAARTNSDGSIAGSVNIALKGIIGMKAMAEIARTIGEDLDAAHYSVSCSFS